MSIDFLKLKRFNSNYDVIEKKREVNCYTTFSIKIDVSNFEKGFGFSGMPRNVSNLFMKEFIKSILKKLGVNDGKSLVFTVKGQAICDPTDEFDEDLGKTIASVRSEKTGYNILKRICEDIEERFNSMIDSTRDVSQKSEVVINHEKNYLKTLY